MGSTIQSVRGGRCMATATSAAWDGAVVSQQTCQPQGSPDFNGRFKYDHNTGQLSIGRSSNCLTANLCPESDLCLMRCAGAVKGAIARDPVRLANQTWFLSQDGSIRLGGDQSLCIT